MNLQSEFNSFFTPDVIDRLGGLIGLDRSQTEMGLRQVLPHQIDGLADAASNPQTAGMLDNVLGRQDLPTDPMAALRDPAAAARTEEMGTGLMGDLLGGQSFMSRLGGLSGSLTRLPALAMPLLLGFLKRSGINSAADVAGLKGSLSGMLPAGAAGLGAAGVAAAVPPMSDKAEVVDSVAATPEVEVREGAPVTPAPEPTPAPPPPPVKEEKSGCNPLWLLPLLLLLGLGWWLYNQSQEQEVIERVPAVTETVDEEEQPTEVVEVADGDEAEGIVVEDPQDGATVPLEPFEMGGYGPPEDVITITNQNGEILATETIDEGRNWVTELPAPLEGENVYTITSDPSGAVSEVRVIGEAGATTPDLVEGEVDTATVVPVEILEPVAGAEVPAETFIVSGTGQPNASYTVFEDGVSLGTVFADETGAWNIDVTAAEPGDRNYVVVDERGNQVAELPLLIAQPVAVDDCAINEVLSLSLADGDTVSAPFRFGGVGSAESYLVKVFRGEDQIGETTVENGPNCTWNYLSQPGGEADETGEITYEVFPDSSDTVDTRITLNVIQSGVNFENGEYVGPVTEPATVE